MSSHPVVIAVDLDGTLAKYESGQGIDTIGPPVPDMVARVKDWLQLGYGVVIFTARVGNQDAATLGEDNRLRTQQTIMVRDWLYEHVGTVLPVTCSKDYTWTEIWDDRAVRVEKNTGRSELHDAHLLLNAAGIAGGPLLQRLEMFIDSHVQMTMQLEDLKEFND